MAMVVVLGSGGAAQGQMFGQRTLGQTLTRQPSPGQPAPASAGGAVSGNPNANLLTGIETGMARFLRDNRGSGSFVGRDRRDIQGFVGTAQAENAGPIQSATGEFRLPPPPNVNRPRPEPAVSRPGPYRPRISLGFRPPRLATAKQEAVLTRHLSRALADRLVGPLQVAVADRTAILEGAVASEYDRVLAEQLVLLEPGVSDVANRLQVASAAQPAAPEPARLAQPPGAEFEQPDR